MSSHIGSNQQMIQEYRTKINANDSDLANSILDSYEQLLHVFKQQNELINQMCVVCENGKLELAQETLDPLEQILYSSLLGVRSLENEVHSDTLKDYLQTLKAEIEKQLKHLKQASITVFPIGIEDLGPLNAAKSYYEIVKAGEKLEIEVQFKGDMKRYASKVETQLFRFIQSMLQIANIVKSIHLLKISVKEKRGQVLLVFESDNLVEKLQGNSQYVLFYQLVNSLKGYKIEQQEQQLLIIADV